jgi:hypothetical protein
MQDYYYLIEIDKLTNQNFVKPWSLWSGFMQDYYYLIEIEVFQ